MTTEAVRQGFRTGDSNYTVEQAWSEWQQFCFKWGGTTEASANAQRIPLMNSKVLPDSNNLKFGSRFSARLNLDPNYRLHKIMDSPEIMDNLRNMLIATKHLGIISTKRLYEKVFGKRCFQCRHTHPR